MPDELAPKWLSSAMDRLLDLPPDKVVHNSLSGMKRSVGGAVIAIPSAIYSGRLLKDVEAAPFREEDKEVASRLIERAREGDPSLSVNVGGRTAEGKVRRAHYEVSKERTDRGVATRTLAEAPNLESLAHELGHAKIHQMPWVGATMAPSGWARFLGGPAGILAAAAGKPRLAAALPLLAKAPLLAHEIGANVVGYNELKKTPGVTEEHLSRARRIALGSALSYTGNLAGEGLLESGVAQAASPFVRALVSKTAEERGFMEGFAAEMAKLSAVSEDELLHHIERLEEMEKERPDPDQLKRYAMIGGALSPVASALEKTIAGEPLLARTPTLPGAPPGKVLPFRTLRQQGGKVVGGAIAAGVIPVVRHHLDRAAERHALRKKIQEIELGEQAGPEVPPVQVAPPEVLPKVATSMTADAHTSPKGRLASTRRVGLPRITEPEGPSIAQIAKPHGFGEAVPGSTFGP